MIRWPYLLLFFLAGCASYSGRGLVLGQSTAAEVEAVMGPAAAKRSGLDGETVLWFPRMPYGDGSYAARVGADGRLIAIEQRLAEVNIPSIARVKTPAAQVRDPRRSPYPASH